MQDLYFHFTQVTLCFIGVVPCLFGGGAAFVFDKVLVPNRLPSLPLPLFSPHPCLLSVQPWNPRVVHNIPLSFVLAILVLGVLVLRSGIIGSGTGTNRWTCSRWVPVPLRTFLSGTTSTPGIVALPLV